MRVTDPKAAQCGEVLKGVFKPHQSKLFGKECTPERPIGALMGSSEGACAAYYHNPSCHLGNFICNESDVVGQNKGEYL
ncbi:hypothetical protein [Thermus scotoductus]|uniref:hypothetical protein n=1 Tax=Thermus scotoductus TaxID=37636 RepID=UPI0023EA51E0|nr:hypothetical protein [Thermus scotoductus]